MTGQHVASTRSTLRTRKTVWMAGGVVLAALLGGAIVYWPFAIHHSPLEADLEPRGPFPLVGAPSVELGSRAGGRAPWFRDVTPGSGIDFTHKNGEEAGQFTILETVGGGVALLDYDGDGLLDIFVTGGGYFDGRDLTTIKGLPCKLYKNLGGWKFQDVTKQVGLDVPWWYTHGAAVADYDRDGWPDLLVTGYGKIALFHNEPDELGGRRFVDVSAKLGLRDDLWSTSAGWADLDGDGFPDLYVCNYLDWSFANNPYCPGQIVGVARDVCPPQRFKPLAHALFRNDKGQSFRNVSAEHRFKAEGCGMGVVLVDVNDDGRPDIYVANDASNNQLFINRNGKLEEKGMQAGVAVSDTGHFMGSMGVDAGDFNGSGRPSLWVTNFQGEVHGLFANLGQETFDYHSPAAGVAAIGQHFVGFGTAFVDVDNDGWEDLVIANGHVLHHPSLGSSYKQRPVLLRNVDYRRRRFFQDISSQGGPFFQAPTLGRGVAIGDLDNDGWPDLVFSHINSPVVLLRNEAAWKSEIRNPKSEIRNGWLGIKLVGRGHRDIVGSTIIVQAGGRQLTRFAKGGGSYLSASDPRLLFGLGTADQVGKVTVKWSWGQVQSWDGLRPNAYWELREGQAAPRRVNAPARTARPEDTQATRQ